MGDILFLAHRVPFPPNRGDKIRAHHLLRKLATIAPVHVGCFAETAEDRAGAAELARIAASNCVINRSKPMVLAGVEAVLAGKPVSLTAFHSARIESWVRATIANRRIETIVIFSGQMGQYVPDDFAGRVVIDLCDVDSAKFESYAEAGERVWINAREARLLAREEERLGHRADATILITEAEAELFRSRLHDPSRTHVKIIGNGIDAAFFDPSCAEPHRDFVASPGPHFVFTGQMDYRPNEQAALWVIDEVLPRIRKTLPQAQFHVVGRNPTARLMAQSRLPGVNITGEVADVRPYLVGASCVLAPLRIARGVQNKVLEAMAMRCAVLLTPEAATGIAAADAKHWAVCHADPDAFAQAAIALAGGGSGMAAIGNAAREFVLQHHAWEAILAPLDTVMNGEQREARDAA